MCILPLPLPLPLPLRPGGVILRTCDCGPHTRELLHKNLGLLSQGTTFRILIPFLTVPGSVPEYKIPKHVVLDAFKGASAVVCMPEVGFACNIALSQALSRVFQSDFASIWCELRKYPCLFLRAAAD